MVNKKKASWWQVHRPSKRRLIQLYCAVLYNAQLKGFVSGRIYKGSTKAACVPGLNCYSCPGAVGACPLGALQNALGHSGNRIGFYVFGILMLYGLMLGRTICGWLCPVGMIQELLHKIPTPKIRKSRVTRALSNLKYVMLFVFAAAIPMWYELRYGLTVPGFCKYICPAGTFEGAMALLPGNPGYFNALGILFANKVVIMVIIGLASVFCFRAFCRFLCPLGAIYGMFNKLAVIGVKVDLNRCSGCGACVRSCEMDIRKAGDRECISCGKCIEECRQNAISIRISKLTLKAPEAEYLNDSSDIHSGGCAEAIQNGIGDKSNIPGKYKGFSRITWGIALIALSFALLWYNVIEPAAALSSDILAEALLEEREETPQKKSKDTFYDSNAPLGSEVGQQLPDFKAQCLDGSLFQLSKYRGKPVFINLWATYCGPCIKELPYFTELCHEHEGDIAMLAVHNPDVTDDVAEFLKEYGADWDIPFTIDSEEGAIWSLVNGSDAMPQTIVLNRRGEVIYNVTGSISLELLEELYLQAAEL